MNPTPALLAGVEGMNKQQLIERLRVASDLNQHLMGRVTELAVALRRASNTMATHMWDAQLPFVKSGGYAIEQEYINQVLGPRAQNGD